MSAAMQYGSNPKRRLGAIVGATLIHAGLIAGFVLSRPGFLPEPVDPPVFDILMMRIQPSPLMQMDARAGGGAPAAASRIHRPPDPLTETLEMPAPPVQAPLAALEVGLAAVSTDEPDMGRGGEGTGAGEGVGSGDGAASGRGTGPVLISGPRGAVVTADVATGSLTALPGPYAVLQCYIGVGRDRLEDCRVKDEHPSGAGVGAAALRKAEEFRYRSPSRPGRFGGRHRQTIAVAFPPPKSASGAGAGGRH